jgi:hypothetical protein
VTGKEGQIQSKKGRLAGSVIAGSMLFWLGLQWLAAELNLSVRLMLLIDFVVIAACASPLGTDPRAVLVAHPPEG